MPTVARQFAQTLKETGVRFVFGVPSGNMIGNIEALRETEGIDFILVGHESTASFMAGVCGRLTGIPGVCFGTFGPGATNLSTGVGGAFLDRFPLIAFTDEMPDHLLNRTVQMNIDHQQLFKPITKWTTRLKKDNVRETILKAFQIAVSEVPGPVHIGVPAGIGSSGNDEWRMLNDEFRFKKKESYKLNSDNFESTEFHLKNSERPVIAVGLSAVRRGVGNLVINIAEKFQIPVVLTPMAKGMFPESHPLYLGVLFHALSDQVAKTYRNADLVIGIGYDPVEFNYEDWMPNVPLVHFDTRPADVDTNQIQPVFNVLNDLKISLERFLKIEMPLKKWDLTVLQQNKNEMFRILEPPTETFGPRAIIAGLRNILPDEGILTVDVGAHLHLIGQMWRTPAPEKLLMTNGWSSMGFAIPAALAAKLCNPDLPVVAIMGDGGFLMTVGELATAKRLNLKIVFIVISDNSLSLIRIKQEKKELKRGYGTDLDSTPVEPTNHYFGVPVIRVENKPDYEKALQKAFSSDGPVLIDALTNGNEYDELVLKSSK